MCCQALSDFFTLTKCCCGIPLKMATYITGGFILIMFVMERYEKTSFITYVGRIYFTFIELEDIQIRYVHDSEHDSDFAELDLDNGEPALHMGAGVGIVDGVMRSQDGFKMTTDYVQNFMRGLTIAWMVINGIHIISTCLMLYGNAKDKPMLLLQWLVLTVTIAIGNVVDMIIASIYFARSTGPVHHRHNNGFAWLLRLQFGIETGALFFAFIVVRSHYFRLTLPSIPVSFKTLKRQENQDNTDEEDETGTKQSSIDV